MAIYLFCEYLRLLVKSHKDYIKLNDLKKIYCVIIDPLYLHLSR